jgi:hypothetical protein
MHFDQDVHAEVEGQGLELGGEPVVQGGHDQQHAVRAEGSGLENLIRVQHEVLAQDRQIHGGAGGREVLVTSLEIGLVGEDRQAGGAPLSVGPGEGDRREVRPNQTLLTGTLS